MEKAQWSLARCFPVGAVSMVGYKALMSMANHGRHELLRHAIATTLSTWPCSFFLVPLTLPCSADSLLLQTGIISAQHALLLLESVLQKKVRARPETAFVLPCILVPVCHAHTRHVGAHRQGKLPATERVVAEILQYIGPAGSEATSVLKVAAANSSANVLAMLLDWSHQEKKALDLQVRAVGGERAGLFWRLYRPLLVTI